MSERLPGVSEETPERLKKLAEKLADSLRAQELARVQERAALNATLEMLVDLNQLSRQEAEQLKKETEAALQTPLKRVDANK